jgi:hypothetical protein
MALIAVAADKGAPGVTTSALALAAVWPRPVLLAECDPAGGDIVYRLPGAGGTRLDPRRGLLSLAVTARRGVTSAQVWEHVQKLRGGLDVLLGVATAEQGSGLDPLWDAIGAALAALPGADVIADCGRLGPDGPYYELLVHAAAVVLVVRPSLGEVVRLRDRAAALSAAVGQRGGHAGRIGLLVVVDHRGFGASLAEVGQAVGYPDSPVSVLGAVAYEPRSAELLRGEWGGKLGKSLLIRTAREVTARLVSQWPAAVGQPAGAWPATGPSAADMRHAGGGRAGAERAGTRRAGAGRIGTGPAGLRRSGPGPSSTGPAGVGAAGLGWAESRPGGSAWADRRLNGTPPAGPVRGVMPPGQAPGVAWLGGGRPTPVGPGCAGQPGPGGSGRPPGPVPQSSPPWLVLEGTDPRPTVSPHPARPRHAAGPRDRRMPPDAVPVDGRAPLDGRALAAGPGPAADLAPLPAPRGPAAPGPALPRRSRPPGRGRHAQPRDGRAADRGEW